MPYPSVSDDGRVLELDLHGASVDYALRLIDRCLAEASRRGRSMVRVIHGSSTSDELAWNRSIKHALYDALDAGTYSEVITGVARMDAVALLSLPATSRVDLRRISIHDVQ